MLCITLFPGEYVMIGDDIILQYDCTSGDRCRLGINAPREIPVIRGAVLEREGAKRPDCIFEKPRWCHREVPWNHGKAQALKRLRRVLEQMDDNSNDVQTLRRQLNYIFPAVQKKEK